MTLCVGKLDNDVKCYRFIGLNVRCSRKKHIKTVGNAFWIVEKLTLTVKNCFGRF